MTARRLPRLVGAVAAGGVLVFAGASAASAAASFSLFGSCKSAPVPGTPGNGIAGAIAGRPTAIPALGHPAAGGWPATEYEQYGFAGLAWYTYDLGCLPDPGDEATNMAGEELFGAAKVVVAVDIAVHDWAASTGWIAALSPMVTQATHTIHQALFTPWAAISLGLLALTLLVRAHRGELAGAVTIAAWALAVLALVAGVTAYPVWAAEQVSSLVASTINSMDAGFVGPRGERAAADAHASLVVSAVLYRQWVTGEFGSANSPQAHRWGPALLHAQALTWQQAAGSPAEVAAAQQAKENTWASIAAQVKASDPPLYPVLQGKGAARIGVGALTFGDAVIVCGFDTIASLVIIVAMLFLLVVVIFLPAFAVVGLHHSARQVLIGVLSRATGLVLSAVLYAAAEGVNLRASAFLLSKEDAAGALSAGAGLFGSMFLQLALGIALFLAVRKIRTGRTVPRTVAYGGLIAAEMALRRRHGPAPAPAAAAARAPDSDPGPAWVVSVSDAQVIRSRPALPAGAPGGGTGGTAPEDPWGGGGPGIGRLPPDLPPDGWPPPVPPAGHDPPGRPDGPGGTGGYHPRQPGRGEWPPGSMPARKNPDGTWQVYTGSTDLGDDPADDPGSHE